MKRFFAETFILVVLLSTNSQCCLSISDRNLRLHKFDRSLSLQLGGSSIIFEN